MSCDLFTPNPKQNGISGGAHCCVIIRGEYDICIW